MAKRNAFVRVQFRGIYTENLVHISNDGARSDYATLCGLSGNDDEQQEQPAKSGDKVNCPACFAIWECVRHYRKSDFCKPLVEGNADDE